MPAIKDLLKFYENYKNFPTIYIISRVNVYNINEKADLTRFLNTLRLIPKIKWIVVENTPEKSEKIKKFLQKSGVNYVHLNRYVRDNHLLDKNVSLEQFDEGLNWLRTNYHNIHKDGVVYLARIQTSYETKIFELMRRTKKVMVWPVGMVNKSLYSRPLCIDEKVVFSIFFKDVFLNIKINTAKVVSWYCPWKCQDDLYPIHESAFAINLNLIADNKEQFSNHRKYGDFFVTYFLKNLIKMEKLEAPECNKV